ncbi:MAG: hypothetical protein MK080_04930 [Opitutales bacterium]|nr:hypothetical protein [Opitutales bacterium]NRA27763.1 ferrous iron transporter B [Opitutales bacterium]
MKTDPQGNSSETPPTHKGESVSNHSGDVPSWPLTLFRSVWSLALLFAPACFAVVQANALADRFYEPLGAQLNPWLDTLNSLPGPFAATLGGDYGVVSMFPFLLLYALPTILVFSILIAVYKSTGLIDTLSNGLRPLLIPFGLGGPDLVRVVMGFGCNVPAIIATHTCSSCSRGTCVSAISFGSACSYQLPATLAVFAAVDAVWLGPIYLAVLAATTLIYLRLTRPKSVRQANIVAQSSSIRPLTRPSWSAIWRESAESVQDFFKTALPIFVIICVVAGLLEWSGALTGFSRLLVPVTAVFNLPPEAALAIVLGSVRKDGIAIGLLDTDWTSLKVPLDTPFQLLTAVYLAGVLLPCLVTIITVAREMQLRFALKMVLRQVVYAMAFSLCIAWMGRLFYTIIS